MVSQSDYAWFYKMALHSNIREDEWNKEENGHRFAVGGELLERGKEREWEREIERDKERQSRTQKVLYEKRDLK